VNAISIFLYVSLFCLILFYFSLIFFIFLYFSFFCFMLLYAFLPAKKPITKTTGHLKGSRLSSLFKHFYGGIEKEFKRLKNETLVSSATSS